MTRVGVLALQGAFIEHEAVLEDLGAECVELRRRSDLDYGLDALVLPGGESTVMGKLLRDLGMLDPLKQLILDGTPVLGTCAGMILLARDVDGKEGHIGTMDISVHRNAYGRQLGSFSSKGVFKGREIPLEFIRAPAVTSVKDGVAVLCECDGIPVAVEQGDQIAVSFHPELTSDDTIHKHLLDKIRS